MTEPPPSSAPPSPATAAETGASRLPETLTVPAWSGRLQPAAPERVRQLRRHLVEAMRAMREMSLRELEAASVAAPEPAGFRGRIARAACALCGGWCCSKGGEHAYLDGPSMARVRRARPELDAGAVLRLYVQAAANPSYAGSCIFHGEAGCTLDRGLRSNLCNRYFCNGLGALMQAGRQPPGPIVIRTADGAARSSPVLEADAAGGTLERRCLGPAQ